MDKLRGSIQTLTRWLDDDEDGDDDDDDDDDDGESETTQRKHPDVDKVVR